MERKKLKSNSNSPEAGKSSGIKINGETENNPALGETIPPAPAERNSTEGAATDCPKTSGELANDSVITQLVDWRIVNTALGEALRLNNGESITYYMPYENSWGVYGLDEISEQEYGNQDGELYLSSYTGSEIKLQELLQIAPAAMHLWILQKTRIHLKQMLNGAQDRLLEALTNLDYQNFERAEEELMGAHMLLHYSREVKGQLERS